MRQSKAKRLRAEHRDHEPERVGDPVIMFFIIALILSAMILYIFILQGEWIAVAVGLIVQILEAYLRWVN